MKNSYMKRLILPFVLVGGSIATASLYPTLASAQIPNLPSISAETLLTNVLGAKAPIYSGTVQVTSNTGIPSAALTAAIPNASGSLQSLAINALTGTSSNNYWVDGSSHARIQVPSANGEINLYASPSGAWIYDSSTNVATEVQPPSPTNSQVSSSMTATYGSSPEMTPSTVVSNFLNKLPSGATVSVATNAYVAGEPTYTLVVSPNDPKSVITSLTLSVDANNFDPLGVAVNTASGQALSVSYTQLSFAKPPASIFSFVPSSSMIQRQASTTSHVSSPQVPTTSPTSTTPDVTHIGQGFSTIVVHQSSTAPSASMQKQLAMLSKFGTQATTSLGSGYVVSLSFGSIFVGNNGSYAAGAVTPATLLSAIS